MRIIKTTYNYWCGSVITPVVSSLSGKMFTLLEMVYLSSIGLSCLGARYISSEDLSVYFGEKIFKKVLPLCGACKASGNDSLEGGPLHTVDEPDEH